MKRRQDVNFKLANTLPGHGIVISGLAGRFPESDNAYLFKQNLFSNADMVTGGQKRWKRYHKEMPQRFGKINGIDKLDVGYFGIGKRQANCIDPTIRLILEKAVEAVIDAGINPKTLEGSNTGVYIGISCAESQYNLLFNNTCHNGFAIIGCTLNQAAQRISYHLKLNGPSWTCDTACSSSGSALQAAYADVRSGKCDQAIVGSVNLCLFSQTFVQFFRLGLANPGGTSRPFDNDGNGYVRAEAACAILLQKENNAKRIYTRIVHAKVGCEGYKVQGISHPTRESQVQFLEEFYEECGLSPSSVNFVEAHGPGTKVGDIEEVSAIAAVLCRHRSKPLLMGSVKSNMGHTEGASGLCAITKIIFAMETGFIAPNINFNNPRREIEALYDGRIKVVTEKTQLEAGGYFAAVNNLGFGGTNFHCVMTVNEKLKTGQPVDDLPRLVCASGRMAQSIHSIFDDIKGRPLDADYIRLYHDIFSENMENELHRGFAIYNKSGEIERSINTVKSRNSNICFVFNGFNEQWLKAGRGLCAIPAFMNAIRRIDGILEKISMISIYRLMEEGIHGTFVENALYVVAIQVGLIDILSAINVVAECTIGNDMGQLICAYYDELLSLDQLITAAYYIALLKSNHISKQDNSYCAAVRNLEEIIVKQEFRSSKWNHSYEHINISLVEVLLKAVFEPLEFERKNLPSDVLFVLFGATNILSLKNALYLLESEAREPVTNLLSHIGRLYQAGINSKIANIYPEIIWPVCTGTPMISPLLKWNYNDEWYIPREKSESRTGPPYEINYAIINTDNNHWAYLKGHTIDGNLSFPAAGHLYLVWNSFADKLGISANDCNVVFENVKFMCASNMYKDGNTFNVSLTWNGEFEITERDVLLASGRISKVENDCPGALSTSTLYNEDNNDASPLLQRDIYKKLNLLGYNYSGSFRGIKQCNKVASKGLVNWEENWITFIDSMIQLNILQKDTRNLIVPTGIAKLLINTKIHKAQIKSDGTVDDCRTEANITSSGGVEITGLDFAEIRRRKLIEEAVTECYQFISNEGTLDIEQCMRVNTQIILENHLEASFKMVEVYSSKIIAGEPLCCLIQKALSDEPRVIPEIKLLTDESFDLPDIDVESNSLTTGSNYLLIVGIQLLTNTEMLRQAVSAIADQGYIISRQDVAFELQEIPDLEIITYYKTACESIVLLRRYNKYERPIVISIDNSLHDLNWTTKLHQKFKNNSHLVVVSQNIKCSGILGFVKCIRREAGGSNVRCVFIMDEDAPSFSLDEVFYATQLRKGLGINVYKNHKWGTYRHLLIKPSSTKEAEGVFLTVANPGDLSSLTWFEGPLFSDSIVDKDLVLIYVYFSALNVKDILTATGSIPIKECLKTRGGQGFEFAGRNIGGERVFGIAAGGALSTLYAADSCLLWSVPDNWNMEEAVTVPIAYSTVLYALVYVSKIQKGHSILIHCGSGGVGQAAINIALHYACVIFTTVETEEKKAFIRNTFPQILEEHIGSSRDTSFLQMIYEHTNGQGVDVALNSLSQEKLHATVRCVAMGGRYLEIGQMDLIGYKKLSLHIFENGITATGVMIDKLLTTEKRKIISNLVSVHIKSGAVKPLNNKIYDLQDIETAYRFMASGNHIGKVVIKIRPEERDAKCIPRKQLFPCQPNFYCNPDSTYIIIGGLGGFGLELAEWLILKGCKKLILVSRHGLKTGYQVSKLRFWQKYTSMIYIRSEDVTTKGGCTKLLKEANKLGPVDGIFNLAVDLKDMLFENQSIETFTIALKPKAIATYYLDEVSRQLCPQLRYFVVFSSVSAGRGNPGQTNYGLANSITENICENRYAEGYPSLAVQWGAVGEVGIVAEMNDTNRDIVIGGTRGQRILNCLEVLNAFLCQNNVIVSSMVIAEKSVGGDIDETICKILGIKDVQAVNEQTPFRELGMDSIVGLEIKVIIERKFDCMLTNHDLKSMSFQRLKILSQEQYIEINSTNEVDWIDLLFKNMNRIDLCDVPILRLNTSSDTQDNLPEISFLPGIVGYSTMFQPLISRLHCQAFGCQYLFKSCNDDIHLLAKEVVKYIKRNNSKFTLVAYSFGCSVALEVIALLEKEGCLGKVILIDGSPQHFKMLKHLFLPVEGEDAFKTYLIKKMLQSHSLMFPNPFEDKLIACSTIDEKIGIAFSEGAAKSNLPFEYVQQSFDIVQNRIKAGCDYERSFTNLKSSVKLLRPKISFRIADDYGLSEFFEQAVEVKMFDADHDTILTKAEVAIEINEFIQRNF